MKKTLVIIFSILLAEWTFSCTNNKKSEHTMDISPDLAWQIKVIDRECPVVVDNVGSLTEVTYDEENNIIDYVYTVNDEVYKSLSHDVNFKDIIKITKIQFATNIFQQRSLLEYAIKDQVPLRIIFRNKNDPHQIDIVVTVEELKDIINRYPSQQEAYLELLKMDTDKENKKCPSAWEDGIRTVSTEIVYIDGHNYINYDYEIDEQIYQLFMLDEFRKEFEKETEINVDRVVNTGDGIIIMVRADCGYRYNYFSKKHNKNFVFEYPASKMKTMVKDVNLKIAL